LRPAADGPELTGRVEYAGVPRRGRVEFRYEVVRVWQRPARGWLRGGLGTLPLAVLGRLPEGVAVEQGVGSLVQSIDRRLLRSVSVETADQLMAATFVLAGLRLNDEAAVRVFQGVRSMQESSTYQYILRQGEVRALQRTLMRLGRQQFGPPNEAAETSINGLTDIPRLERMLDRVHETTSWQDLLATP
jgi:hypothetical protein